MSSPWGPPFDVLPALAREEQALLDVLGDLAASQWPAVHDLAARILGDKLRGLSRDRDGHQVEGDPAMWVAACRPLSSEVLFALLVDCSTQLVDVWKRLDPDEVRCQVPVWLEIAREYAGYWVYQQQIREAVDVPLLDQPEFLHPVVETFMCALPDALSESTAPKGKRVTYAVTGAGTWTATRTVDGWTLDRSTARAPLASVSTDPDTFWRLCARSVRLADVRDRVTTKGDEETCEAMLTMS